MAPLEEWRAVLGGDYEVSSEGRFRRARPGRRTYAGRLATPVLARIGYLVVGPTIDGRNRVTYVHALVAEAFLGPRPAGADINHIDGVKTNNHADNLEYVSHAGNMAHAARTGLMSRGATHPCASIHPELARAIRAARNDGMSYSQLAARFGVAVSSAFNVVRGTHWSQVKS